MSLDLMKRLAARLPLPWQEELKRIHHRRHIRRQSFGTSEPEFDILATLVSPGDWVIDVGANVGHYTKRLSDLVGPLGRVIAAEPVPETFALLAANVGLFEHRNVTLLNLAVSNTTSLVEIHIPQFTTGLRNYYQAAIRQGAGDLQVLTLALNSLELSHRIALVKIDAEGHDKAVVEGMGAILVRDLPTLIVEDVEASMIERLDELGYRHQVQPNSPNTIFRYPSRA